MNPFKKLVLAVAALGAMALAACSTGPEQGNPQELTQAGMGIAGYKLGSGDEIKVTVYGEPDLSGPFVVDGQGSISMSLVGQGGGVTPAPHDTRRRLEDKPKDGWLKEPNVNTEWVNGRT